MTHEEYKRSTAKNQITVPLKDLVATVLEVLVPLAPVLIILFLTVLAQAQTRLSNPQFDHPPTAEERWCPSPILEIDSTRTVLTLGRSWSPSTPCYMHFNLTPPAQVDPISVSSFVEPLIITINPSFINDDVIYIFASAPTFTPVTPAKVGLRLGVADSVSCGACAISLDTRNPRMFPASSVPIGIALIRSGKFLPPDIILNRQQVFIGPGAEMSVRSDQGGLWFEVNAIQAAQAAVEVAKATSALRHIELSNAMVTSQAKQILAAPEVEQRVTQLEKLYMEINGRLPKTAKEAVALQDDFEATQSMLRQQIENLADEIRSTLAITSTSSKVTSPKTMNEPCKESDWAVDQKYVYFCVAPDRWTRAALSKWKDAK